MKISEHFPDRWRGSIEEVALINRITWGVALLLLPLLKGSGLGGGNTALAGGW
jgi:hypothetical protein